VDRRRFLLTSLAGALAAPLAAEAQKAAKFRRIGFVLNSTPVSDIPKNPNANAFFDELRKLGWGEGQNIEIVRRSAVGRSDRFPEIMRELVQLEVDVIVVSADIAAIAAKKATSSIPIVMAVSVFADKWGLVASLAKPGGNVTGLSMIADASLYAKRLEYFREIAPGISRLAVLAERGIADLRWPQMETAAQALGLVLLPIGVDASDRLPEALVEVRKRRAQGSLGQRRRNLLHRGAGHRGLCARTPTAYDVCFPRNYSRRGPDVLRRGLCGDVPASRQLCR
jgi:putative tryptophan/tyrosine transport system substrate-binding protein